MRVSDIKRLEFDLTDVQDKVSYNNASIADKLASAILEIKSFVDGFDSEIIVKEKGKPDKNEPAKIDTCIVKAKLKETFEKHGLKV